MGIAADNQDNFYAVWLDLRKNKMNNIYFSSLAANTSKWSKNILVYQSPQGNVCPCCKPNIAVKNGTVAIMFRNLIDGSRDLYVMQSANKGNSFGKAQKLGTGTWKLDACPMDGGGLVFDNNSKIHTTWQRQGVIYICQPGEKEIKLAQGRGSSIATNAKNEHLIVSFQQGENAKLIDLNENKELIAVKGSFIKSLVLGNGKILCVWELNKSVMFAFI
jgi:hypothetical protein